MAKCYMCQSIIYGSDSCPKCHIWLGGEKAKSPEEKRWEKLAIDIRKQEKKKYEQAKKSNKTGLFRPNIKKLKQKGSVDRLLKALKHRREHIRELATSALAEMECWQEISETGKVKKCITCGTPGLKPPFSDDPPPGWHDVTERKWSGGMFFDLVESYTVLTKHEIKGTSWTESRRSGIPGNKFFLCANCFSEAVRKDEEKEK